MATRVPSTAAAGGRSRPRGAALVAAVAAVLLAGNAAVAEEGRSGAITVFQPGATPAEGVTASAAAPRDALQRDAEALLVRILAGDEGVLERATPELRATLDANRLRAIVAGLRGQAGNPRGQLANRHDSRGGMEIITLTTAFERANIDVRLVFDGEGRLAGLSFRPADVVAEYKPADYALPARFRSREVRVGVAGWLLPGDLALPEGEGPFPAIVLVHGAGPQDRDGTVGPNKPFRDLAEGLANRGVAVLRYDKRTLAHEARVGTVPGFDIDDEVVDDAAAAVAWLRAQRGIDGRRVFVLGHGFGGMLAPRIARAAPGLAGVVVLAGAVKPLEESIIAQTSYLAGYDGRIDDEERIRMSELLALRARVRELQPGDPPLVVAGSSAPASWWHSLRGIDAPAEAARLPIPVLALQGERDFQVTMEDFGHWQRALAAQPRSRAVAYPALNHLFIAGSGRSHPNEYALAGHVAVEVIDDIARWIDGLRPDDPLPPP